LTIQADISSVIGKPSFEQWKQVFKQEAISEGINSTLFDQAFYKVIPDPVVIKLDTSQPEFTRNIWDYIDNATVGKRLKRGQGLLQKHALLFDEIEKIYGVQREIIVAIWAMESDFGRNYGSQNVIRSLATLAHQARSEKREKFAKEELLSALQIIQNNNVKVGSLIGSWAGAMGQPQFMPSSYKKYAVDYNQDGKKNIWETESDVFASIANFLKESGWRELEDWGVEVNLPQDFDWKLNTSAYELRFVQWRFMGVTNSSGQSFKQPQRLASIFIPAGRFGPAFLVTHNFNIIKKYNQSLSYTLAVAQLSRLLAGGESIRIAWPRDDKALSSEQVKEIQTRLNDSNHNSGVVDGKVGSKTREAVRTWQLENGFAGDGYVSIDLLEKLQEKIKIK
jgi:membrane-bound lytic murein transglycosylase B